MSKMDMNHIQIERSCVVRSHRHGCLGDNLPQQQFLSRTRFHPSRHGNPELQTRRMYTPHIIFNHDQQQLTRPAARIVHRLERRQNPPHASVPSLHDQQLDSRQSAVIFTRAAGDVWLPPSCASCGSIAALCESNGRFAVAEEDGRRGQRAEYFPDEFAYRNLKRRDYPMKKSLFEYTLSMP
ncbi:hypothetical protein B0H10DRAFT_1968395 [Mycena sp. CBHHK59/15]|nr:hypothetical protein B0H10DRAFT_1968395 [Mycena sp. CBHHK59/15]